MARTKKSNQPEGPAYDHEKIERLATESVQWDNEKQQLALLRLLTEIENANGSTGSCMATTAKLAAFKASIGLHDEAIALAIERKAAQQ